MNKYFGNVFMNNARDVIQAINFVDTTFRFCFINVSKLNKKIAKENGNLVDDVDNVSQNSI